MVENNGYAISVPAAMEVSVEDVADRASGYGMPGVVVDGDGRPRLLRGGARRGRAGARRRGTDADRGEGDAADRRTRRTISRPSTGRRRSSNRRRAHDALPRFRGELRDAGVLTDEIEARLMAEITAAVEDATDYAESQPDPTPHSRPATSMPIEPEAAG